LSDSQRKALCEYIALRYLDSMDYKDLERFFLDIQLDYLKEYQDEELISEIEDMLDEEECAELLNENAA
jgi:hypothetical protein